MRRATPHKLSHKIFFLIRIFVSVVILFLLAYTSQFARIRTPDLKVWFFDIGQGDATFIETPNGQQILVDGGPDNSILQKLSSVMWPWDKTIDAIFVTHPDADHITGLISVLDRYNVKAIYETGVRGSTPMIIGLEKAMDEERASRIITTQGKSFEFDGARMDILWPTLDAIAKEKERNNTSIVIRMSYGDSSFLLTGDAQTEVEDDYAKLVGDIDVLKVGHHGSKTSTSVLLLKTIKPEFAIISDGVDNKYGHPHPIVLERLKDIGAMIFRTDKDGDVLAKSDGVSLQVAPVFLPF
ncbi:MBL fold metallo-hydrolase [Candidatus Uhrbacteria bacterium]|nr:MBL fold metallo-hydrolase [Candidatus Uhrbacteria bacterium]